MSLDIFKQVFECTDENNYKEWSKDIRTSITDGYLWNCLHYTNNILKGFNEKDNSYECTKKYMLATLENCSIRFLGMKVMKLYFPVLIPLWHNLGSRRPDTIFRFTYFSVFLAPLGGKF